MDLPAVISPALIDEIRSAYRLNWQGLHGWDHWVRVWEIGQRLAQRNGANMSVVALFAFTHDMSRNSDGADLAHGPRAAHRIRELHGTFFELSPVELDQLTQAVKLHTAGLCKGDLTVRTCWDSDRLDLGRAGITPNPKKLCTAEARDPQMIAWAHERSQAWRANRS